MSFLTWAITFIIAATPYAVTRLVFRLPLTWRRVVDYFPIIAGALYPIARFLPEPHITAESITLVQHFVGGGFVSALYFFFLLYKSRSTRSLLHQFAGLYFFTSGMGVANELLEFCATKLGLYKLDSSDVWWDLLANTLGAFVLFTIVSLFFRPTSVKKA